jgi:hypothetical protein
MNPYRERDIRDIRVKDLLAPYFPYVIQNREGVMGSHGVEVEDPNELLVPTEEEDRPPEKGEFFIARTLKRLPKYMAHKRYPKSSKHRILKFIGKTTLDVDKREFIRGDAEL